MVVESDYMRTIRSKLNVLGYTEPFGEDSLPLVEKLLRDLILTTHGLRESKRNSSCTSYSELEDLCKALKNENLNLKSQCLNLQRRVTEVMAELETKNSSLSPSEADKIPVTNIRGAFAEQCKDLHPSIMLLQTEKELMDKKAQAFKKQIECQEEEIKRLHRLLGNRGHNTDDNNLQDSQKRGLLSIIERLQSKVDSLQTRNSELEQRLLLRMETTSKVSPTDAPSSNGVNKFDLSDLLDNFEKTNGHFVKRTDELLNSQKQLVLEIDRLNSLLSPSKRNSTRPVAKRTPSISTAYSIKNNSAANSTAKRSENEYASPIKEYIEGLLADREVMRTQVECLNRSLRRLVESDSGVSTVTTPSSNSGGKNSSPQLDNNQNAHTQTSAPESPAVINGGEGDSTSETLRGLLKDIESERDHYRRQSEELEFELRRISCSNSRLRPMFAGVDTNNDLETVKRERNELQAMLNKFESNLLEIQEEVRLLKSERDQLLLQLEQAPKLNGRVKSSINPVTYDQSSKEEILSLRKALEESTGELETAKITIRELESDLEQLRLDLDRVISEKTEAEKSKGQLQTALSQTQSQNSALANELMMQKNMYNEAVRGKQLSNSALSEAQRDLQVLNSRIKELEIELKRSKDEIIRLNSIANELSAENDDIRASLDDRTEDTVILKRELTKANKFLEEKTNYLQSVEKRLRQVTEMAADKDREVQLLTERLQELETASQVVSQCRNISEQKYAKAQSDMRVLAVEVESLNLRLQSVSTEKHDLQRQLTEAMQGLTHSERAMDMKLKEHKDLLVQYGSLSREFEETVRKNKELEGKLADIDGVLKNKEADLRDQLDRAQKAELEALNARRELLALEEKCTQLYTSAEKAEMRASLLEGELEEARRQLLATRDIAGALQTQLDQSDGHSVSAFAANKDLSAKLTECELKLKDALIEISHQRKLVSKLEILLASARENQSRLQDLLDNKTKECENLCKSSRNADLSNGLEPSPGGSRFKNLLCNHQTNALTLKIPVDVIPTAHSTPRDPIGGEEMDKIFYNPVEPSLTSVFSSISDISNSSSHSKKTEHLPPTTMKVTQIYEPEIGERSQSPLLPKTVLLPTCTNGIGSPLLAASSKDTVYKITPAYVPRNLSLSIVSDDDKRFKCKVLRAEKHFGSLCT